MKEKETGVNIVADEIRLFGRGRREVTPLLTIVWLQSPTKYWHSLNTICTSLYCHETFKSSIRIDEMSRYWRI